MSRLETESINVGAHEFRFIPPDQLHFVMRGVFRNADAIAYLNFIRAHALDGKCLPYATFDLREMTRMDDAARKLVINVGQPYALGGVAVVGAGFSIRTLADMLIRAGKIIAPQYFTFPHKFVGTTDEAYAWFDELRAKRANT